MNRRTREHLYLAAGISAMAALSCSGPSKIETLQQNYTMAELSLPNERDLKDLDEIKLTQIQRDTFVVHDFEGHDVIIMKAIRDDEGDMVAHDVIEASYVTARFRNVAERFGKIDISFNVTVPESMQDDKWQLRFYPDMFVLEDSLRLDPIYITGKGYRAAQLKGYQLYEKFLNSIIRDETTFINLRQLEIYLHRHIPQVYYFRNDSSYVDEEVFQRVLEDNNVYVSLLGVTKDEAVEHYTDKFARWLNRRRISQIDSKREKYIKAPIVEDGIRLDTVMQSINGDYIYCYTTTINTRPKLRKVDVVLSGDIWDQDKKIYTIPRTEPLTFYISSLSAFVDNRERYMTKVIERRAEANSACWIDFELAKADVKEGYSNNASEIARIKDNIRSILENDTFDLDSITVRAASSPEGGFGANQRLSQRRSQSVVDYFQKYIRNYQDSVARSGFTVDENGNVVRYQRMNIPFRASAIPENWDMLDRLVDEDEELSRDDKADYELLKEVRDLDTREKMMSQRPYYRHLREKLYPRVRTVSFQFAMHRKGMVKDTVHTTELDEVYMEGVQAIRDREYEKAVTILRPYNDYNTAVAFLCMGYDKSAMSILKDLPRIAEVNYMLAVLYSREGDDQKAVEHYLHSVSQDNSFRFRGSMDPEINSLIKKYGLLQDEDDDDLDYL